ncbi:hypothetical protein BHE90_006546 [Fusarium euwallaceae]|uniref:Uncharacterized protein n=1 Tax=Fusarium euwallaceae TaxID=1147111 RepID=A0A430LTD4_9HYPO|nr:hypothetical protein BHE90_006546 [Fusarium euwallaceae]
MKFTLRAVDDGGLQVIPEVTVRTKTDWNRKSPSEWRKQCIDGMTEHVKRVLENLKNSIFKNIDEGLKSQQTMHLPGEGLFFLSDPTFNQRGDLLATLTWNGTLAAAAANDSTGLVILPDGYI